MTADGTTTGSDTLCIVGIGASAGGLEAIRDLLEPGRAIDPFAYVVVQHLDPNHDSLLAELLDRNTELTVKQAVNGEEVRRGHVYTIPPGMRLTITQGRLRLSPFEQPRGLRRPIDDFFESLARDQQQKAVCVILSGTGADGSVGLRAIKEYGGLGIAQDGSARYDSMPNSAVATGLVDFVCAPEAVIERISRYRKLSPEVGDVAVEPVKSVLEQICTELRRATGHDFGNYKTSTLERRIRRRMQVAEYADSIAYLEKLRNDPAETEALLGDLLINVTRFFRDRSYFDLLGEKVVDPLVRDAKPGSELRVWVPGCSSGEEAYSVAMLFDDAVRRFDKAVRLQIFASDIDERMLDIARAGCYPVSALLDIPEHLRDHYAIGRDGSFQLSRHLRDLVRFSVHSLIKDPPFSRIDLISCRNLLIYFDDQLQSRVLPILHYALKPGGILFLGPSESIGRAEDRFTPIEARARIFRATGRRAAYPLDLSSERDTVRRLPRRDPPRHIDSPDWKTDLAKNRIIDIYAPPTLQLSQEGAILSTTGRLSRYIETDPAETGPDYAQSVARPGLRESLSGLIRSVREEGSRKIARNVEVLSETGRQRIDVIADPLADDTILIVFRDRAPFEPLSEEELDELAPGESQVQVLEAELRATRSRLRSTVEELETANEELKSSNEEMMSMNEELQSTNEELSTVNDELKSKLDELSQANADLRNFFQSEVNALITVDRNGRLRNFTEGATSVIRLRDSDRGRPLSDMQTNLDDTAPLDEAIAATLRGDDPASMQVRSSALGKVWSLAATPYRNSSGATDGTTLVFTDVTNAVTLEESLAREAERVQLAIEIANIGIWSLDSSRGEVEIDDKVAEFYGLPEGGTLPAQSLLSRIVDEDRDRVWSQVTDAITQGSAYDSTFAVRHPNGRLLHLRGIGRVVNDGPSQRLLGLNVDITAERDHARMRELLLREMNHRVKNLFSIVSGMLRIAARTAETPQELVTDVSARINALARSHDMARSNRGGQALDLRELLDTTLAPFAALGQLDLDGPRCPIPPGQLTSLALILHEWSTNAAKYGVLGPVEGKLQIRWSAESDGKVTIAWNEIYDTALPLPDEAKETGFGSTLVQISAAQLDADIALDVTTEHRTYRITFPNDVDGTA